jgi:hypothetical protein
MRDYPLSKPEWKRQSNKEYRTNHSAYGPVIICNHKQGHNSDRRTCKMMTLNEILPRTITCAFVLGVSVNYMFPFTYESIDIRR